MRRRTSSRPPASPAARRARRLGGAAAEPVTPALIEAAKKEGKVTYYTAMDLQRRRADGQGLRGQISRHQGRGRAHRRRAPVQPHRPGDGEQDLPRRRGQQLRRRALPAVEAPGLAGAVRLGGMARDMPADMVDPDGTVLQPAHPSQRHRLQHQAGRAGRCAQGLHGPARSEIWASWSRAIPAIPARS